MEDGRVSWLFNFDNWKPSEIEWENALRLVSKEERIRICSFKRPTERGFLTGRDNPNAKASLIGLLLIRESIHQILGLPYHKIKISRTPEGKPYLQFLDSSIDSRKRFTFFNFNISHSGQYVVCVTEPNWLVGVDVMSVTTNPLHQNLERFFQTMKSCFTDEEWEVILQSHHSPHERLLYFYIFWTLKEAYLKAIGIGLGFDLRRIQFSLSTIERNVKETTHSFQYQHQQQKHSEQSQRQLLQDLPFSARIKIDNQQRDDWRFDIYYWKGHVISVAYGPPTDGCDSFKQTILTSSSHTHNMFSQELKSECIDFFPRLQWQEITSHELNITRDKNENDLEKFF